MDYPLWYIPGIGGAMVIATIAVIHVFISHFAVGMGLYIVLAEKKSIKTGDQSFREFVRRNALMLLLVSAVIGALTGVGIWFSIALVSPAGTSALIHIYVWGWASEWTFFVLEIVALLIYYYTWGKVSDKFHVFIGWIYFISAWMSLFIINGIITFQLTTGNWVETRSFWDGFFNATFWPSLIGRTGVALLIAGIYAGVVVALTKDKEVKVKMGRFTGWFIVAGTIIAYIGMYWWSYSIPEEVRANFFGGNETLSGFYQNAALFTLITAALGVFFNLLFPKFNHVIVAFVIMALGLTSFGYYEFTRERVRKPYIIRDYMYSNGILLSEVDKLNEEGILSKAKWANVEEHTSTKEIGFAVYKAQCNICHDMYDFNALAPLIEGLEAADLNDMFMYLDANPLMPPFVGTDEEREALAEYLADTVN
ncbi:cytochrome ubiquinol oxidase subunit I [Limisalsivibrio acetivorans]|uniref:cytochrome ubiquinol oxidase subunit I n=1 Tax=Limisalsivibrio acetivorans TaxID=1304888 RepID=UPI0003B79873|nr:cytochrome ubiquinol oxidase subunit I [Limisalsivibrio acetivorans]